jgi:hypothetical protein
MDWSRAGVKPKMKPRVNSECGANNPHSDPKGTAFPGHYERVLKDISEQILSGGLRCNQFLNYRQSVHQADGVTHTLNSNSSQSRNADHFACHIDERASTVAWINRSRGFNHIVVGLSCGKGNIDPQTTDYALCCDDALS